MLKFNFGAKLAVQRTRKEELFPDTPVLTMIAPNKDAERRVRKFELNLNATEMLGIDDNTRTISFAWAGDLNNTQAYLTAGEHEGSITLNKNSDTFSSAPLATSLNKHYDVSLEETNHFELVEYDGETPNNETFYLLTPITTSSSDTTEDSAEEVEVNLGENETVTV